MAVERLVVQQEKGSRSFDWEAIDSRYNRHIKRYAGLVLALVLIVLLLPVYIIIAIAIFIDSGFPVFYRAYRGGYQGNLFEFSSFGQWFKTPIPSAGEPLRCMIPGLPARETF